MEFTSTSAAAERFTQVRRGYDPAEVEAFQAETVRALDEYEARLAEAIEQLDQATKSLSSTQVDEDAIHATFVEAVRTKEQMLDEAEAECRRLIADAESAGIAIREHAERETQSRVEAVRQAQLEALADVERMREQARRDLAEYRNETTAEIDHHFVDLTARIEAAQLALAASQAAERELVDAGRSEVALYNEQAMLQLERRAVQASTDLEVEREEFEAMRADGERRAQQLVSDATAESEAIRNSARAEAEDLIASAADRAEELSRSASEEAEHVRHQAAIDAEQLSAQARGAVIEATERAQSTLSAAADEAESIRAAAMAGAEQMRMAAANEIESEQSEILAEAQTRFRTAGDVVRDTRLGLEQAERTRAGVEMRAAAQAERLLADAVRDTEAELAERMAAHTRDLEASRERDEADLAERIAEAEWQVQRAEAQAQARIEAAERRAAAEVAEVHGRVERLRNTVHRLEEQFSGVAQKAMSELSEVVGVIDTESAFGHPQTGETEVGGDNRAPGRFDDRYMSDPGVANKSRIVVDLTKGSRHVDVTEAEEDEAEELPGFYEKRLAGLRERLRNAEDTA